MCYVTLLPVWCVSLLSPGVRVFVIWQHTFHGNSETHAYVSCVLFCYINTKQKKTMNSKKDKIIFATKHQPPHNSHLLPFYTFDTSFTQVFMFFVFVFHLYTRSSSPQTSFLTTTPPRVFLSVSDIPSSTSDGCFTENWLSPTHAGHSSFWRPSV